MTVFIVIIGNKNTIGKSTKLTKNEAEIKLLLWIHSTQRLPLINPCEEILKNTFQKEENGEGKEGA